MENQEYYNRQVHNNKYGNYTSGYDFNLTPEQNRELDVIRAHWQPNETQKMLAKPATDFGDTGDVGGVTIILITLSAIFVPALAVYMFQKMFE